MRERERVEGDWKRERVRERDRERVKERDRDREKKRNSPLIRISKFCNDL